MMMRYWSTSLDQRRLLHGTLIHQCGSPCTVTRTSPQMGCVGSKRAPQTLMRRLSSQGGARQTTPFAQGMRSTRSLECSALEKFTLSPTTLHVLPPASDKVNKVKRSPAR